MKNRKLRKSTAQWPTGKLNQEMQNKRAQRKKKRKKKSVVKTKNKLLETFQFSILVRKRKKSLNRKHTQKEKEKRKRKPRTRKEKDASNQDEKNEKPLTMSQSTKETEEIPDTAGKRFFQRGELKCAEIIQRSERRNLPPKDVKSTFFIIAHTYKKGPETQPTMKTLNLGKNQSSPLNTKKCRKPKQKSKKAKFIILFPTFHHEKRQSLAFTLEWGSVGKTQRQKWEDEQPIKKLASSHKRNSEFEMDLQQEEESEPTLPKGDEEKEISAPKKTRFAETKEWYRRIRNISQGPKREAEILLYQNHTKPGTDASSADSCIDRRRASRKTCGVKYTQRC